MTNKHFKIFIDFDGTITKNDVGEEIFKKFLDEDIVNKIVEDLKNDKITARDCWEKLCKSVSVINKNKFDDFILSQEIDTTLHSLVNYCKINGFELIVLSDGFDYYIEKILRRENLIHLKFYSNKLTIIDDGKMIPSFPYYNHDSRSSANCKQIHIIENSGNDDYSVFIGDGNSDNEAIQFVDFIFAKDELLKYCEINRITFFPFKNFDDIVLRLDELSSKKRLKRRHQAELKRREIFMIE